MSCALYMWGDNTKGQVTLHLHASHFPPLSPALISLPQLGSGDKKAYHAPYCVTGTSDEAAPSAMRIVHSVVCGEMMTAAIDTQAQPLRLRIPFTAQLVFRCVLLLRVTLVLRDACLLGA